MYAHLEEYPYCNPKNTLLNPTDKDTSVYLPYEASELRCFPQRTRYNQVHEKKTVYFVLKHISKRILWIYTHFKWI